ncbi:FliA/WhiG family RNA polymerase sigma factor [Sphaerobacter thermophilus]|uniref:RNA polymerase, sigma 28 subunit, FliA/WhiG n=1 Tax=Sphaerobacter thermophilus (strain ATCC 49802 / DSM 20745 / KCCM 41009 / NCIMB 13125 / S 6022) TaxID=479434 RepID=D1C190_SPHTD|nr:FliA/WhiG family RNA polymerase sigma factor [Sphaerobacter thermophilus]ACZ38007.1 RNA polymerase, sigma 28 subunit, FliA/WhiG [Sphaerobacter thermophilus DSM 20745]
MSTASITVGSPEAGTALWRRYAIERDGSTREALIRQYAPLVKYVVDRLRVALTATLDRDDLLGYGTIGLIEAIDRFDPERGVKFETFAIQRIRGAIIDAVRTLDLVPRTARQRARAIEQAYREIFAATGRMPPEEEVAAHLGMTIDAFRQALQDAACAILPLQQSDRDGEGTLEDTLPDAQATEPLDAAVRSDLVHRLAAALERLPERDRLIVTLYYYEELTLREISEVLGITESRVSQLLSRARLQLRALLHEGGMSADDVLT